MGFFNSLGHIAGEIITAPISFVSGAIEGATDAIERATED